MNVEQASKRITQDRLPSSLTSRRAEGFERVFGLIRRRAFHIRSLSVGHTEGARTVAYDPGFNDEYFLPGRPFTTVFAAQELANKGVAVLQLGESPLYDQTQGTLDWGPAQLSQVESAIDYLDDLEVIDTQKVGLAGFSITGFIVRYALENSTYTFSVATSAEGNDYGYWSYIAAADKTNWATQSEAPTGVNRGAVLRRAD